MDRHDPLAARASTRTRSHAFFTSQARETSARGARSRTQLDLARVFQYTQESSSTETWASRATRNSTKSPLTRTSQLSVVVKAGDERLFISPRECAAALYDV